MPSIQEMNDRIHTSLKPLYSTHYGEWYQYSSPPPPWCRKRCFTLVKLVFVEGFRGSMLLFYERSFWEKWCFPLIYLAPICLSLQFLQNITLCNNDWTNHIYTLITIIDMTALVLTSTALVRDLIFVSIHLFFNVRLNSDYVYGCTNSSQFCTVNKINYWSCFNLASANMFN